MKQHSILLFVSACALLLSSCASGPGFAEAQASLPKLAANQGRVFVYRTTALGAAVQPMIMINGKEAGRAKARGFVYMDVAPGAHNVQVKTEVTRNVTVNVAPGQSSYVRLDISMGFAMARFTPVNVSPATAAGEIAKCKKVE